MHKINFKWFICGKKITVLFSNNVLVVKNKYKLNIEATNL